MASRLTKGEKAYKETAAIVLDGIDTRLPRCLKSTLRELMERYDAIIKQLKSTEKEKAALVKQIEPCQRLMAVEGIGEVCAAMLYANIGNGKEFRNGRDASVYIGLTPKQDSPGGKTTMIGIGKHNGNKELKAALYQGALSFISRLPAEPRTAKQSWLIALVKRAGIKRACIALANKSVRTSWAILATGKHYEAAVFSG
jgi:transposase